MLTWKIRLAFPCGMRSECAVMEQVKPAECSHGYGQQNLKLQIMMMKWMTFCDLSGPRVGLEQIGARRRFYFSERRCARY